MRTIPFASTKLVVKDKRFDKLKQKLQESELKKSLLKLSSNRKLKMPEKLIIRHISTTYNKFRSGKEPVHTKNADETSNVHPLPAGRV